jgi:hypothetical protein
MVERVARVLGTVLEGVIDPSGDVGRLFLDRRHDTAGLAVEAELRVGVPDVGDGLANDRRHVDPPFRERDLSADEDEASGHEGLARHAALRVLVEERIQDRVGDLVGELVGVALGDGLRREQVATAHGAGV